MEPERSRTEVFSRSVVNGAVVGVATGAVVGAAVGIFVLLKWPPAIGEVFFAVLFGGIGGTLYGTVAGLVSGTAVGLLTGVLLLCAGVRRLDRRGARVICALTPALVALAAGVWHITETWPIILAFWVLAAPLGIWRAPYVLDSRAARRWPPDDVRDFWEQPRWWR